MKTVELGEAELAWERAALERYVQASAEREGPASVTARLQFP